MDCSDLADHKELVENTVASFAEFPMKSEANMRLLPNATGWQQQNAKRPAWSFFCWSCCKRRSTTIGLLNPLNCAMLFYMVIVSICIKTYCTLTRT